MAKAQIRCAYWDIFTGNENTGCDRLIGLFWDNRGIGTCHNCRVMYCREHYNMWTQLCDICTRDPEEGRKWGDHYRREVLKQGPKKPRQSALGRPPSLPHPAAGQESCAYMNVIDGPTGATPCSRPLTRDPGTWQCSNCHLYYCSQHTCTSEGSCYVCAHDSAKGRAYGRWFHEVVLGEGPSSPAESRGAIAGALPAGLLGVLMVLAGLVVLGHALLATLVSVILVGCFAVLGGLAGLVASLSQLPKPGFWPTLPGGALVVGIALLIRPGLGAVAFTLLLGTVLLLCGVTRIVGGMQERHEGRTWVIGNGIVTLLLGLLLVVGWPGSTLWALGTFLGVALVVEGVTLVVLESSSPEALRLRSASREVPPAGLTR